MTVFIFGSPLGKRNHVGLFTSNASECSHVHDIFPSVVQHAFPNVEDLDLSWNALGVHDFFRMGVMDLQNIRILTIGEQGYFSATGHHRKQKEETHSMSGKSVLDTFAKKPKKTRK